MIWDRDARPTAWQPHSGGGFRVKKRDDTCACTLATSGGLAGGGSVGSVAPVSSSSSSGLVTENGNGGSFTCPCTDAGASPSPTTAQYTDCPSGSMCPSAGSVSFCLYSVKLVDWIRIGMHAPPNGRPVREEASSSASVTTHVPVQQLEPQAAEPVAELEAHPEAQPETLPIILVQLLDVREMGECFSYHDRKKC